MDSKLRSLVRVRASEACEYCLVPDKFDQLPFQLDHIIADKHGGPTESDNLAWSCYDCNIYKGPNIAGLDPVEGVVMQLFHPRQQSWQEHFEFRGAEIHGRTPVGRTTIIVLRINLPRRVSFRQMLYEEGLLNLGQ
jgi:hypothetical protein